MKFCYIFTVLLFPSVMLADAYLVRSDSDVVARRLGRGYSVTQENIDRADRLVVADRIDLSPNYKIEERAVLFSDLQNVTMDVLLTEASFDAYLQSLKSDLLKLAETTYVETMIDTGHVPPGSQKIPEGKRKVAIKDQLEKSNGNSSGPEAKRLQKLLELESIIKSEGGDPEEAIIHP